VKKSDNFLLKTHNGRFTFCINRERIPQTCTRKSKSSLTISVASLRDMEVTIMRSRVTCNKIRQIGWNCSRDALENKQKFEKFGSVSNREPIKSSKHFIGV
jgi:hypothetical protein